MRVSGQWGLPTVSPAGFMAMLAATITSIIESVGDYYACARISGVPPPPAHAVNRGIAIEGLGSLISGAVGSGGATTSYSQNVGAIGFTKVTALCHVCYSLMADWFDSCFANCFLFMFMLCFTKVLALVSTLRQKAPACVSKHFDHATAWILRYTCIKKL
jgi:xanthine/uracil permease